MLTFSQSSFLEKVLLFGTKQMINSVCLVVQLVSMYKFYHRRISTYFNVNSVVVNIFNITIFICITTKLPPNKEAFSSLDHEKEARRKSENQPGKHQRVRITESTSNTVSLCGESKERDYKLCDAQNRCMDRTIPNIYSKKAPDHVL